MAISKKQIEEKNIKEKKSMKKTILACLALMAISICLFVSCNAEQVVPKNRTDVAYIKFGEEASRGSSFSASVTPAKYDTLYWFYTAKKSTGDGLTGATGKDSNEKEILAAVRTTGSGDSSEPAKGIVFTDDECLGPFSQGKWTFTLKAYDPAAYVTSDPGTNYKADYDETTVLFKDGTKKTVWLKKDGLVYQTENGITVTLLAGQTKTINPLTTTVKAVGTTGIVDFAKDETFFVYKTKGTEAPTITMTAESTETGGNTYTFTNGITADDTSNNKYALSVSNADDGYQNWKIAFSTTEGKNLAVGTYKCTISATDKTGKNVPLYDSKDNEIPITSLTFYFVVYGGATTTIKGTLNENPYSFIKFDVEEQVEIQADYSTLTATEGLKVSDNVTLNFKDAITEDSSAVSYNLKVTESKDSKATDSFIIQNKDSENNNATVKAYQFELEKIVTTAEGKIESKKAEFASGKSVTATLNVGRGLNGVQDYGLGTGSSDNCSIEMYYAGQTDGTIVSYDESEGLLTVKLGHFSEYIVIDTTKVPVKISNDKANTAKFFDNLKNAFANAKEGDTITLLNNAKLGGVIETTENVTLDLNSKTVSKSEAEANEYILVKTGKTLTVKNPAPGQANFIIGIAGETTDNTTKYSAAQAQIGTTCYATLSGTDGAIAKAAANDTVTLIQDVTLTDGIEVNGALTLNMNDCVVTPDGKTITVSGDSGLVITGSNKAQTAFINGIRVSSSTSTGIDGTYYNTLAAAVSNAPEGSTITLFADVTLTDKLVIKDGKNIKLDLGGKTLTKTEATAIALVGSASLDIDNGTIVSGNNSICIETLKDCETKLTVGSNTILQAADKGAGVLVSYSYGATDAIKYKNVTVDFSGKVTKGGIGLSVNGTLIKQDDENRTITINVKKGSEFNTEYGIYAAGYAKWNIESGVKSTASKTAIEIRAGEMVINGGEYKSTAAEYSVKSDKGGTTTSGVAIAVSQHDTKQPINVTINGGEFDGVKQLVVVNPENNAKDYKKLVKVIVLPGVKMDADKIVGTKTGGSTGVDGTYYIDGESAIANGVGASAKISNASGTTFYHTLQDAIDAAESGETITLVDNVNADWLYIVNGLTIDLNNKTLTITNDGSIKIGDYGYDNANVKITNGNLVYNKVTDTIFPHYGIFVYKGSLTLDKVTMTGGEGATGGIYVNDENGASLTVNDSTLTLSDGVGIKFGYGTPSTTVTGSVNIINSTIEGKTYALELQEGTSAVLTNSELKGGTSDIALFGGSKVSGTLKEGSSVTIDETSEGSVELKEGDTVFIAGLESFDNVVRNLEGENVTIKLLQDLKITESQQRTYGKSFTLDLNEKTLHLSKELNFGYDSGYSTVSVSQTIKNGKVSVKNGGYIRFEMSSEGTFENVEFSSSDGKFNEAFKTYALNNTGVNTYTFTNCTFTNTSLDLAGGSGSINKNKYDVKFTNCTFTSNLGFKKEAVSTDYAYGSFVFDKCNFTNEGITFEARDIADAPYDIDIKGCTFTATSMSSDSYFVGTAWKSFVYGTLDISGTTFTATDSGNKKSNEACIEIENSLPSCGELLKITLSDNTFTTTYMEPFAVRRYYTNPGYKLTASVTLDTEKPNTFTIGAKTMQPTIGETEITWSEVN